MSEYTQEDLKRARKIADEFIWSSGAVSCGSRNPEIGAKFIAQLIAKVRAEAQQAHEQECDYTRGFNAGRRDSYISAGIRARLAAAEKLAEACRASVRLLALIRGNGYTGDFLPELDRFIHDDERDNEPNGALAEWEAAK